MLQDLLSRPLSAPSLSSFCVALAGSFHLCKPERHVADGPATSNDELLLLSGTSMARSTNNMKEAHCCNFVCPVWVMPFAISLFWCLRWSATGSSCNKSVFEIKSATSTCGDMFWFHNVQQHWWTFFFCVSASLLPSAVLPFLYFSPNTFVCHIVFSGIREECTIKIVAALAHHLFAYVCVGCC